MTRELIILRHAKSDWNQSCSDFDRPLNKRGNRDAPRIGEWLKTHAEPADHILGSPALRARQTLEHVCSAAAIPLTSISWDERMYLASLEGLIALLGELPNSSQRALLVGHNPGLEELLLYLSRDPIQRSDTGKLLTTATLAHLKVNVAWPQLQRGCATLLRIVRPGDLA